MLTNSPPSTALELIIDNRSGNKLEIVVPIFNEQSRLPYFIKYYSNYDIVFFDGGSTDKSLDIIEAFGLTAYRRRGIDFVGETHFVYYNNFLTKSGFTFYMMLDEFVLNSDLNRVAQSSRPPKFAINVIKIEYLFGHPLNCSDLKKINDVRAGMPRGFSGGLAIYDSSSLHNSLLRPDDRKFENEVINIRLDHLHIKSLQSEYGKLGVYFSYEAQRCLEKKNYKPLLKRLLSPFKFLIFNLLSVKLPLSYKLYRLIELSIYALLTLLAVVEQLFSLSCADQQVLYSSRYR